MSFHLTAQDIRVEDNHILVALLQNDDGEWNESAIDLDQFIGNDNGTYSIPRPPPSGKLTIYLI